MNAVACSISGLAGAAAPSMQCQGPAPVAVSRRILPTWHGSMVRRTGTSLLLCPLSTTTRPFRQEEGACRGRKHTRVGIKPLAQRSWRDAELDAAHTAVCRPTRQSANPLPRQGGKWPHAAHPPLRRGRGRSPAAIVASSWPWVPSQAPSARASWPPASLRGGVVGEQVGGRVQHNLGGEAEWTRAVSVLLRHCRWAPACTANTHILNAHPPQSRAWPQRWRCSRRWRPLG